jgi:hypothetical protein
VRERGRREEGGGRREEGGGRREEGGGRREEGGGRREEEVLVGACMSTCVNSSVVD